MTIKRAAQYMGVSKKTLMRWDKAGLFPVQREEVSNIRYYDKSVLEKVVKWFDLRRREKEHLKKLSVINQKRSKFIPITPLDGVSNPKVQNYEEMKQAYREYNEWKRKYDDLQEEYAQFTERFYGELKK